MSEETKEVATPPVAAPNAEVEALKESVKKLEAKNYELIGKLQNQKRQYLMIMTIFLLINKSMNRKN